jgi:general secretion pathway protein G
MINTNNVSTKKGFTMIELIFVIVIIGILAAVAIPRLAATRDDAKVATSLSEASMVVREISNHYTAKGEFSAASIKTVTNVDLYDGTACTTAATAITGAADEFSYCTPNNAGTLEACISIKLANSEGNITVAPASAAPTGDICKGIQGSSAFADLNRTTLNGGSRVSF